MGKKDEEIERLHGVLKEKNELISDLKEDIKEGEDECNTNTLELERFRLIDAAQNKIVNGMKLQIKELKELKEHKSLMIVNVQIAGGQDIDKALDNSVKILVKRLEALGLKDVYNILAVPHTISVQIEG